MVNGGTMYRLYPFIHISLVEPELYHLLHAFLSLLNCLLSLLFFFSCMLVSLIFIV